MQGQGNGGQGEGWGGMETGVGRGGGGGGGREGARGNFSAQQANLDERSISNPKLDSFMGGSHLVGTEVDCRQQVLGCRCYDGSKAVHLH